MSNACAAIAAAAVSVVCAAHPAAAQSYPSKPIRIIVATAPGGGTDFNGRLVAQKLTEQTGQQVVVENRAGASTIIGTEAVARAAPDGYTLLAAQSTITINPSMFAKLPYDMIRDFAPVSHTLTAPNLLTVHPSVPARTVKEFVTLAKSKPGSLTYGSAGPGTSPHLSGELLKALAKIDVLHVAYKGSGPSLISLIAGETDVGFPSVPASIQHIRSGRLRGIAVTTKARAKALPEVPSIAEGGVAGYEATQWFGILAPAGTPRPVIDKLYQEIARGLRSPELQQRLVAEGMEVVASTPDEFASYIRSETDKWSRVIKSAGIKPQ
jgi:tripartite-type tricarboxylate transporter receptor subunit TctC